MKVGQKRLSTLARPLDQSAPQRLGDGHTLFAAIAWRETDKQYIAARHLLHLGRATFEVLHVFVTSGFPQLELL